MAGTIIDALVVTLGLDPKGFNKGKDDVSRGMKGTREEATKSQKELEAFGKRTSEAFGKLRNEALGLFLAFQGASSIKGYLTDLISGDAATGRLAQNIGLATSELSAWQLAVKTVAGDSKDADAALTSIAQSFQTMQLEGVPDHWAEFQLLGVTRADLRSPTETMLKMAEAGERMDKTEFFAVLTRIGIPPSVINLLEKGRVGLSRLIEEKKRDAAVSDENSRKAQELEQKWADMTAELNSALRPAIYDIVGSLIKWVKVNPEIVQDIKDIGAAAGDTVIFLGNMLRTLNQINDWSNTDPIGRQAYRMQKEREKYGTNFWGSVNPHPPDPDLPPGFFDMPPAANGNVKIPSGTPVNKSLGGGRGHVSDLYNILLAHYGKERADGIWRGIGAESGWDPNALGPADSMGRRAFGFGQWRGTRLAALKQRYGNNPSAAQQIEFLMWELEGGDKGGASVLNSKTASETFSNYIGGANWGFMRPGVAGRAIDFRSAGLLPRAPADAQVAGATTTTTTVGTINVYTAATDAEGIARDLPAQIRNRGLIAQADRGQQ